MGNHSLASDDFNTDPATVILATGSLQTNQSGSIRNELFGFLEILMIEYKITDPILFPNLYLVVIL